MNEQLRAIAELDRVIHEPGRMMILALLIGVTECDFLYLQSETGLNKGNLSSHLAKLEEAGYVEIKKTYRGKVPQTLLRLTPQGRAAFETYRLKLNAAFAEQLAATSKAATSPPKSGALRMKTKTT
ncbi:MAG TPA: transcriptional regulator [Dongiaceae bacterium]|jgi:DNA-binding MarR family transcriptional regulator|nr:transcriptional regulator [Dongiaceae bacterium]